MLLQLLTSFIPLLGKSFLIVLIIKILFNLSIALHLRDVTFTDLHFLVAGVTLGLLTLLSAALFVGAGNKLYLLVDFNWSKANSKITVAFYSTVNCSISERVINLQLSALVSS